MALPDRETFKKNVVLAIQEAAEIIYLVKADPTQYVGDKIRAFGEKWLNDGPGEEGFFFSEYGLAKDAVLADWPDAGLADLSQYMKQTEATGSADNSDAAERQLKYVTEYSLHIDQHYDLYEGKTQQKMTTPLAEMVFALVFKGGLEHFYTLYNTMKLKMRQGKAPALVAGPGQKIKHTPFGDSLVNDTPSEDAVVGGITVSQLRAIIKEELGK